MFTWKIFPGQVKQEEHGIAAQSAIKIPSYEIAVCQTLFSIKYFSQNHAQKCHVIYICILILDLFCTQIMHWNIDLFDLFQIQNGKLGCILGFDCTITLRKSWSLTNYELTMPSLHVYDNNFKACTRQAIVVP